MTLAEIVARKPNVDLARVDATTETDTRQNMLEEGRDPDEAVRVADIISPAVIRKRLGMSQRQFAQAVHAPIATLSPRCRTGSRDGRKRM